MSIYEFARLSFLEKTQLLKNTATLIDNYADGNNMVFSYSLYDFFVEATINAQTETIVDIIPFRRGFLMDKSYLKNHLKQHLFSYVKVA